MNAAEQLLRALFRFDEQTGDVFGQPVVHKERTFADYFAPEVCHTLFGPAGTKELLVGRDAFLAFVARCADALVGRHDSILSITGIDRQCAFVRARAWRRTKATDEEISYEWAMLYRVENDRITYGTDMLDADVQAYWTRVAG